MTFAHYAFNLPPIEDFFSRQGITYLDPEQVESFQEKVKKAESEFYLKRLRQEKPAVAFLVFVASNIVKILLALVLIALLFQYKHFEWIAFGFLATICLFGLLNRYLLVKHYRRVPWRIAPFSDFRSEYTGDIARLADPSGEIHSVENGLKVTLKVESHPFSRVRFLVGYDPNDPKCEEYYLDSWEKQ